MEKQLKELINSESSVNAVIAYYMLLSQNNNQLKSFLEILEMVYNYELVCVQLTSTGVDYEILNA